MGESDCIVLKQQTRFIDNIIKNYKINKEDISKIAYLGNQNDNSTVLYYKNSVFPNAQHDLYDIALENWDINKQWGIEGYDLVVCHRTTPFVKSLEFFSQQLKSCIFKNKYVIFDFTTYSGLLENYYSEVMQILSEEPPSLSARFDFRNTFKLQRTIDYLVKFITIRAQHNYFKVDMLNSFTEKTFEENNIIPTFINSEWNAHKKDMITYAFWRQC